MDRSVYLRMNEQEESHWWFAARRNIIAKTIERLIKLPEKAYILEAGCGTGGNLEILKTFGRLDAFEFDSAAREISEIKSKLPIKLGSLPDAIPFEPRAYNLIGLFDVLEHIKDDEGSLRALGKRLKSDGCIFVTVPALPWLWSKHDERHHHFRRYTRNSLSLTAKRAGLEVVDTFYFNSLLLPLAICLRAVKAIFRSKTPDDTMPSPWLNRSLYKVFSSEQHLVGKFKFPIGLSVCAILKIKTV